MLLVSRQVARLAAGQQTVEQTRSRSADRQSDNLLASRQVSKLGAGKQTDSQTICWSANR